MSERAEFEKVIVRLGYVPAWDGYGYLYEEVQVAWQAWQSARAHDSCQGNLDSSDANPFITLTIVETEPGNLMIRKWRTHGPVSAGEYELYTASQPAEQKPDVTQLVEALELALEYWRHRQQRYKNRRPMWVIAAESALAARRKQGGGQ